jgi:type II secretory pathway pseudopilin PulG
VEIMIVLSIMAILAMIAAPKFGQMIRRSQEAGVKGKLGAMRSAAAIYYAETSGENIAFDLGADASAWNTIFGPYNHYIEAIPLIQIPGYTQHEGSAFFSQNGGICETGPNCLDDGKAWGYDTTLRRMYVNCQHTDYTGIDWSSW